MKTTMLVRNIANPRRTTLAHLDDAQGVQAPQELPEHRIVLPAQTANPRRTILMTVPQAGSADAESGADVADLLVEGEAVA